MTATIFVSIACYRDWDVLHTVKSLLDTATTPLRIRVLVQDLPDCWRHYQVMESAQVEVEYRDLIWAEGPAKARAAIMQHLRDEPYVFQADSHMRFAPGWDAQLMAELDACPVPGYLTTLPPNFQRVTEARDAPQITVLQYHRTLERIPLHIAVGYEAAHYRPPATPPSSGFLAAGVLFGRNRMFRDVPLDPYLYFFSEEFGTQIRLWSHGYIAFNPRFCFCWHAYRDRQAVQPPTVQQTGRDLELYRRGLDRLHVLLGMETPQTVPTASLLDFDRYGLGPVHSVQDWEQQFSIRLQRNPP